MVLGVFAGIIINICTDIFMSEKRVVRGNIYCMTCERKQVWYEFIPFFLRLGLECKCKACKMKRKLQYPLVEISNGLLWLLVIIRYGITIDTLLGCLFTSALLTLSVIDAKTKEIPFKINVFIGAIALINMCFDYHNIINYVLGMVVIAGLLFLLFMISGGGAIGGGDVKLMAAAGLYLGLPRTCLAFFLACILGSIIHIIRMKFFGAGKELAMGPYLAAGLYISFLYGGWIIESYPKMFL